jgi:hypothetical protein
MNPLEAKTEAFLTLSQALDRARAKATDAEVIRLLDVALQALEDLDAADTDQLLEELGLS